MSSGGTRKTASDGLPRFGAGQEGDASFDRFGGLVSEAGPDSARLPASNLHMKPRKQLTRRSCDHNCQVANIWQENRAGLARPGEKGLWAVFHLHFQKNKGNCKLESKAFRQGAGTGGATASAIVPSASSCLPFLNEQECFLKAFLLPCLLLQPHRPPILGGLPHAPIRRNMDTEGALQGVATHSHLNVLWGAFMVGTALYFKSGPYAMCVCV